MSMPIANRLHHSPTILARADEVIE